MATVDNALREIAELRRQLIELQTESRANTAELGTAIRKTRLALATVEQNEAVLRLRPSTSPIIWEPRTGDMSNPELSQSLIDRLRRGDPVSNSLGGTGLYVGQSNLLLDGVLDTAMFANSYTTGWQRGSADFLTKYELLQGSPPGTHYYTSTGAPGARQTSEYMSAFISAVASSIPAGCTFRHDWWFVAGAELTGDYLDDTAPLPFLVASLRFVRQAPYTPPLPTTLTGTLEIHGDPVDGTGTVVATATWNLADYPADAGVQLTVAAVVADLTGYTTYGAKFRVLDETGSATDLTYRLYEPQIHYAFTPDPVPFSPAISRWNPTWLHAFYEPSVAQRLIAFKIHDEAEDRFRVYADGRLMWGNGTDGLDSQLARVGTGVLGYESDLIAYDDSAWSFTYNPDGTVATATRGGEQGAANVTVSYGAPGEVSSVVTTKGGRTITVNPTYTDGKVTYLTRTVT